MSKKLLFNFNREAIQNYTYVKYVGAIITATNTLEKPIKSAILKGSTKYRDIDTGEVLDAFEDGRNLELVSVKMPVLTTSDEDGTKTNILTVNEEVELRGIADVQDELNCLTGEVTQRVKEVILNGSESWMAQPDTNWNTDTHISFRFIANDMSTNMWAGGKTNCISDKFKTITLDNESYKTSDEFIGSDGGTNKVYFNIKISRSRLNGDETVNGLKQWLSQNPITVQYKLATESVKTVDLSILDQNENKVSSISSFNDTTHITASSETIPPIFEGYLATKEVE